MYAHLWLPLPLLYLFHGSVLGSGKKAYKYLSPESLKMLCLVLLTPIS